MSENRRKIQLPIGTSVSFEGESNVYHIERQELIHACPIDCDWDHDCYEEDYVVIYQTIGKARPLSKLKTVFDEKTHIGRPFVAEEWL